MLRKQTVWLLILSVHIITIGTHQRGHARGSHAPLASSSSSGVWTAREQQTPLATPPHHPTSCSAIYDPHPKHPKIPTVKHPTGSLRLKIHRHTALLTPEHHQSTARSDTNNRPRDGLVFHAHLYH